MWNFQFRCTGNILAVLIAHLFLLILNKKKGLISAKNMCTNVLFSLFCCFQWSCLVAKFSLCPVQAKNSRRYDSRHSGLFFCKTAVYRQATEMKHPRQNRKNHSGCKPSFWWQLHVILQKTSAAIHNLRSIEGIPCNTLVFIQAEYSPYWMYWWQYCVKHW